MPTEGNNILVMLEKYLEFSQALASKGQKVSFSIGSNLFSTLDTKHQVHLSGHQEDATP